MKFSAFICKSCKLCVAHIKILNGIFSIKIRRYDSGFVYCVSKEIELFRINIRVSAFQC